MLGHILFTEEHPECKAVISSESDVDRRDYHWSGCSIGQNLYKFIKIVES